MQSGEHTRRTWGFQSVAYNIVDCGDADKCDIDDYHGEQAWDHGQE